MRQDITHNSEGDVVLIYYQDEPTVYARIESIEPDVKKGWYRLTLLMLTVPPQIATWILREEYINGASFTMGGRALKIEPVKRVIVPEAPSDETIVGGEKRPKNPDSKVIQIHKRKLHKKQG